MKNHSRGMTVIELMTALLVLSILLGLAVPSFSRFASDSRTRAASSDLTTALSLARSEALRRSTRVIACASTNGTTCSNSTTWTTGWLVCTDANNDAACSANELIYTWGAVQGGIGATSTSPSATYTPIGIAQLPVGANAVTFRVAPAGCTGDRVRQTVLVLSGSMSTTKVACP